MRSPQKVLCFFCTGTFLIHTAFSQTILVPYRDKNLWGFADTNGNIRIKPVWDQVKLFGSNETATPVHKDGKVGVIDTSGRLLFPVASGIAKWGDYFHVTRDNKMSIYSSEGKIIIPAEYDKIYCTCYFDQYEKNKGQVIGEKNGNWYLITLKDATKKPIQKPSFATETETVREGLMDDLEIQFFND